MPDLRAFLTGSYAYGTPHRGSDIDLVVFMSKEEMETLRHFSSRPRHGFEVSRAEDYISAGGEPLYFGNLNMLVVWDEERYKTWLRGTEELKARKPVSRHEAIRHFRKLRREAGFVIPHGPEDEPEPETTEEVVDLTQEDPFAEDLS